MEPESEPDHGRNPIEDLPHLRTPIRVATKVGPRLGGGPLLLGTVSTRSRRCRRRRGAGDTRTARAAAGSIVDLPERGGPKTGSPRLESRRLACLDAAHPRCGPTPRSTRRDRDHPEGTGRGSIGTARRGAASAAPFLRAPLRFGRRDAAWRRSPSGLPRHHRPEQLLTEGRVPAGSEERTLLRLRREAAIEPRSNRPSRIAKHASGEVDPGQPCAFDGS